MNDSITERQDVIDDIENLENLLARENRALAGTFTIHLSEIVVQKQAVIEKIAAHVLTPDALSALGEETLAALGRCKKLNEENNLLVNQRLKVVRQANSIVGSHTNQGSVELYDQMGKIVMGSKNTTMIEV